MNSWRSQLTVCVTLPQNVIHELRITNQVIYLNPPIEDCRYKLYQEMFSWKTVILSLSRIQSQRYQVRIFECLVNSLFISICIQQHNNAGL